MKKYICMCLYAWKLRVTWSVRAQNSQRKNNNLNRKFYEWFISKEKVGKQHLASEKQTKKKVINEALILVFKCWDQCLLLPSISPLNKLNEKRQKLARYIIN